MSRDEAAVLIARLHDLIDDLRDLSADAAPQHVIESRASSIRHLTEAASELRRLHSIGT